MNITYQIFKENGYIISTPTGVATTNDVKRYLQTLLDDPKIDTPFFEIVDFTKIETFDFGYLETPEMLSLLIPLRDQKGYKGSCLVVNNDLTKSMSNIIHNAGREIGIPIRTFKSLEDACNYASYNNLPKKLALKGISYRIQKYSHL